MTAPREIVVGKIDAPPCPAWCEVEHKNRWDAEGGHVQHMKMLASELPVQDSDTYETLTAEIVLLASERAGIIDETTITRTQPYVEVRVARPAESSFKYDVPLVFAEPLEANSIGEAIVKAAEALAVALDEEVGA